MSGIGNFFIALWLTDPVTRLSRATRRFASGDLHARAQIPAGDEIGQLAADFNHMATASRGISISWRRSTCGRRILSAALPTR